METARQYVGERGGAPSRGHNRPAGLAANNIHVLFQPVVAWTARAPRGPWQGRRGQAACKPGSVQGLAAPGRPFLCDARCRTPDATHPGGKRGNAPAACRSPGFRRPPLFGLAPGGVCRAAAVAGARGALLPHRFTLASRPDGADPGGVMAVCSLWHCPWGCPRRALPGTVFPWSPDFPHPATFRQLRGAAVQPPDPGVTWGRDGGCVKRRARAPRRGRAPGRPASASRHRPRHRSGAAPSVSGRR